GDPDRAEQLYLEGMKGELLPVVATRYALFLIDYRPQRTDQADKILNSVLQREPNFGRAIIGKVHCELRPSASPDQALARITAVAEQFKDDVDLAFNAAYVSLH